MENLPLYIYIYRVVQIFSSITSMNSSLKTLVMLELTLAFNHSRLSEGRIQQPPEKKCHSSMSWAYAPWVHHDLLMQIIVIPNAFPVICHLFGMPNIQCNHLQASRASGRWWLKFRTLRKLLVPATPGFLGATLWVRQVWRKSWR